MGVLLLFRLRGFILSPSLKQPPHVSRNGKRGRSKRASPVFLKRGIFVCWICNPYCGKCRPPDPKPVTCAECGEFVMLERNDLWICSRCGSDLPRRKVYRCNWTGRECDIPCMRNVQANATGLLHACPWEGR